MITSFGDKTQKRFGMVKELKFSRQKFKKQLEEN